LIERVNARLSEIGAETIRLESAEHTPASPPEAPQRLVGAYSRAIVAQAERNAAIVVLDADLVLDCGLIPFSKRFPERFFECGIAEQDMVSQAGGFALRGLLPVVHSFACFLSTRPNEQIYNNATERTKIMYVAPLAGLLPAGPGHSHQSVRDISSVGGMPGLVLVEPSCEAEVELAVDYCVNRTRESTYLRLASIPVEIPFSLPEGYRCEEGRGVHLREGADAVIISYGPAMLTEAWGAADRLRETHGLEVGVVNLPWLNRVDAEWLGGIAKRYPCIVTLDDHYVQGGQGQMIAAALAELSLSSPPALVRLGVTQIPRCGLNAEVLRVHQLDAEGIAEQVTARLGSDESAESLLNL
jgi:transketolase